MFVKLDTRGVEQYEEYWQVEKEEDGAMWKKVRPMAGADGSTYAVRCFDPSKQAGEGPCTFPAHIIIFFAFCVYNLNRFSIPSLVGLPYELLKATKAMDAWALGAMLYQLLCGETLLFVNRDDNLNNKEVDQAANWTDEQIRDRLMAVKQLLTFHGMDLVEQLLRVDSGKRLQDMEEVLGHPFFTLSEEELHMDP
jgi:hypothetical protein